MVELISNQVPLPDRDEFFLLMKVLDSAVGTVALGGTAALVKGRPRPFRKLPQDRRERIVRGWQASPIPDLVKAAKGIKTLAGLALFQFATPAAGGRNPYWDGSGYPGPPSAADRRPPVPSKLASEAVLLPRLVDLIAAAPPDASAAKALLAAKGLAVSDGDKPGDVVVEADAVVVGSGAGGGVAAGVLASAGLRVIVLEKGQYWKAADLPLTEAHAFPNMYERGGVFSTRDLSVNVLAGAGVGGGTRINWCASFPTPAHVRKEWAEEHGLPDMVGPRFDRALAAVCGRVGVSTGVAAHSNHNACLGAGLEALGDHRGEIPRNCDNAADCGMCCLGCPTGERGDMTHTFLADAAGAGAVIIAGAHAERVLTSKAAAADGRKAGAVGVLATPMSSPIIQEVAPRKRGAAWRLIVRAPRVFAAGGTMHTPAFLKRSGITCGGWVGRNLRIHPATIVYGRFPAGFKAQGAPPSAAVPGGAGAPPVPGTGTVKMWSGAIMSAFSNQHADWEGTGYGPMLMTPSMHVAGFAGLVPWQGGAAFKSFMAHFPDWSSVLVITRDRGSGTLFTDRFGHPRYKYWGSKFDRASMVTGIEQAVRALAGAGAVEVGSFMSLPHLDLERGGDGALTPAGAAALEAYVATIKAEGVRKNRTAVMSAHQMGTARLGGDPKRSACDPDGQTWQTAGVYVCDGAAFPTSSGLNPMMTIEAIAYMVAEGVALRAGKAVPGVAGAMPAGQCAAILESSYGGGRAAVKPPVPVCGGVGGGVGGGGVARA
jgi:long-chain-alcohol oxidase